MKRIVITAIAALALVAPAFASSGNHWCRGLGDPSVLASKRTSCPFAYSIVNSYYSARQPRHWRGQVSSPVTHKRYWITCRRPRVISWRSKATCTGAPATGIWTQFGLEP